MGVEVTDKTVGVVGLGRIGVLVAQRLAAFGVTLIAYDPYIQPGRAAQLGVRLVLAGRAAPRVGLHHHPPAEDAGDPRADRRRGAGHHQARRDHRQRRPRRADRRGGAGRRAEVGPGRRAPASTSTPRSRAPTARCSACPTRRGHPAPGRLDRPRRRTRPAPRSPVACGWRCRASSSPTRSTCRPAASSPRTSGPGCRWPRSSAGCSPRVAGGLAQSVTVEVRGKIAEFDVSVVQLAVLKGVFSDVVEEQVTYVNAPLLADAARARGRADQRRREPGLPQPDHACAARWPTAPR